MAYWEGGIIKRGKKSKSYAALVSNFAQEGTVIHTCTHTCMYEEVLSNLWLIDRGM